MLKRQAEICFEQRPDKSVAGSDAKKIVTEMQQSVRVERSFRWFFGATCGNNQA